MIDPTILLFIIIVIIFSVIIHELAHGYVAYSLGDPTAKYAGRLTLNPIKHIDLFGSIILPIMMALLPGGIIFGWAKPVPINPYNFRDQKWGSLKVALAGPATNFFIAVIFGLIIRISHLSPDLSFTHFLSIIVFYNFLLAIFNLIPIPPLDGHWILFQLIPDRFSKLKMVLQQYGIFILIFLIFFGSLEGVSLLVGYFFQLVTGMNLTLF